MAKDRLNIALVSDFFCPNTGGVETHIYFLAKCLLARGHKVIVITHAYGERRGIRYLSNGLKVYYLPFLIVYNGASLGQGPASFPWFRQIFISEDIQIVHGHSSFSTLAHEALMHAGILGLHTVFTDHSLFGFADASAILINFLLIQYSFANVDRFICVSYTSKENTVLRAQLDPQRVYTIPNAIETSFFYPDRKQFFENPTTVIFLGRLAYRKGADLLCEVIPTVCHRYPNVQFLIGGDGPKRVDLEEMREKYGLHERVRMLGMLPHNRVREVLVQGQIFINTSLTEAFCMSIVEAASCGLHVVSTKVGGVPEVLPDEFVILEQPVPKLLARALCDAIKMRETGRLMDPDERHKRVQKMYQWEVIAERTEVVYYDAMHDHVNTWRERLQRLLSLQRWWGLVWCWGNLLGFAIALFMEWWQPRKTLRETTAKTKTQ
ncbi:unnamed protein product, partial [Mesorhabditis belari]|uniref:phosphatidylinositol N-acetylglucosaminyltransferase n=1 Tax=Mesorhabditis belari TaxID=2138241 RepID=A0AAF3FIU8_9BILA